ncbi:hypothetical protein M0R45_009087 [Rubus argutus]|uniref:Retrovirus-related Pol polyprotein from transposon TNT 1-94-like beta-barrel domain-containing protein n=1 Tax=Rubus argutus TaxID=59490 RepID=A0AAW1Y4V3_RUBAR
MMANPLPLTPSAPPSLWYADSGTTHHITNDLNNLSIATEYHGSDHVSTANGDSMPISHISSSTVVCASPTLGFSATSGSSLKLNSILYVPSASDNLLSINKLLTPTFSVTFVT